MNQSKALKEARSSDELIREIRSGINLKRRKFLKLMQQVDVTKRDGSAWIN